MVVVNIHEVTHKVWSFDHSFWDAFLFITAVGSDYITWLHTWLCDYIRVYKSYHGLPGSLNQSALFLSSLLSIWCFHSCLMFFVFRTTLQPVLCEVCHYWSARTAILPNLVIPSGRITLWCKCIKLAYLHNTRLFLSAVFNLTLIMQIYT